MKLSKMTFAVAIAGALSAGSMLLTTSTPAAAGPHGRMCRGPVHAMAMSGGPFKPFYVKKMQARRKAVRKWRRKTSNRFGFEFRKWRFAKAKDVHFERRGPRVIAYIKGKPCARHFVRHDRRDHLNDRTFSNHRQTDLNIRPHRISDHRTHY